jgi:hypothetical protein
MDKYRTALAGGGITQLGGNEMTQPASRPRAQIFILVFFVSSCLRGERLG